MRKCETNQPRNSDINEKVDALELAVNSIYTIKMARLYKLLRGLRVWRVCNDMILELERDYTISRNRVYKGSIKSTNIKVV